MEEPDGDGKIVVQNSTSMIRSSPLMKFRLFGSPKCSANLCMRELQKTATFDWLIFPQENENVLRESKGERDKIKANLFCKSKVKSAQPTLHYPKISQEEKSKGHTKRLPQLRSLQESHVETLGSVGCDDLANNHIQAFPRSTGDTPRRIHPY